MVQGILNYIGRLGLIKPASNSKKIQRALGQRATKLGDIKTTPSVTNTSSDVEADTRLMVRHCAWILNRFQTKYDKRTSHKHMRSKDYDSHLVQFVEICPFQNHDADDAKLELQWIKWRKPVIFVADPAGKKRDVECWQQEFLGICAGDPWNPNNSPPGSVGGKTTTWRPGDEWPTAQQATHPREGTIQQ